MRRGTRMSNWLVNRSPGEFDGAVLIQHGHDSSHRSPSLAIAGHPAHAGRFHRLAGALSFALLFYAELATGATRPPPPPPTPSAAPSPPPSVSPPPASASTAVHSEYARMMFARQEYVAAAEGMERAYAHDHSPLWLFNIGQAYRKAARYHDSLRAYQRLLETAPKHPMALETRDHIRTLQILIQQEDQRTQIQLEMAQTQQELERMRRPPVYKRVWFWSTLVLGTAAVVGIGVGAKVYQDQRASELGFMTLQF